MTSLFKATAGIRSRTWIGYALALLLPFVAWGGILPLADIARHFPFIIFLPGIILATLLGGAGPGVLAAAVTMLIVDYALVEPIGRLWPISTIGWWSFGFYSIAIGLNIAVIDGMIRAYDRLNETDQALQSAHAELAVERQRLRAVIDQAPIGVSIARRDGTSESNEFAQKLLGHGLMTADDRRYASYGAIHADGRAYAVDDYPTMRALHHGERIEAEDMLYHVGGRDEDGALRRLEVSSSPIMDGDEIAGAVTILVDVTHEREDRTALETSEALARDYLAERQFIIQLTADQRAQTDPDAVMRLSSEALGKRLGASRVGFYRLANPTTVDYSPGWTDGRLAPLLGPKPTDQFGARVDQQRRSGEPLVFSDSRADAIGGLADFASAGVFSGICLSIFDGGAWRGGFYVHQASVRAWSQVEVALAREVAELTWLAVERAEAVIRMEGRIDQQDATIGRVAGELRDQTAGRSAAEGQVRQLQKMEAVGQLTGGIAHDFNNMLAVVIGGLNLMERRLSRGETDVRKYLDAAMEGATRAAALTQRLLAFARQAPLAPETIDANRMVAGLADLLTRTLGERVQLETVLTAGLWKTSADPNQLENVIVNLAVNARDAMPEGGKLTIETGNAHVDQDYAAEYEITVGQYVLICVSDTGSGMTPEIMAKAFDPFFTTKGVGKGTGLGLSQAFGFVRQSGGHLKVYSEVGHGTTFKLYLPRFYGDAPVVTPRRKAGTARGGEPTEIVMVVEDEQRVRDFSVEALRELGYTVIHASSGAEALAMIEAGQDVTLLFTDIVMPEMTGRQLADRVALLLPQTRVVYTTGYTRNAVVHNGVIDPGTNFLPKPFNLDQLAAMIRGVIDGEGK